MDYLARESSPIDKSVWEQIDAAVVKTARNVLTGRKILQLFGPLGAGVGSIPVDDAETKDELAEDGFITTQGRRLAEIPTIYEDFTVFARDMAASEKSGYPLDLSRVMSAAQACALKEDSLIFSGKQNLGYDGLLTAAGSGRLKKKDWTEGENAFTDVAAAMEILVSKGVYGAYALVVSPNLYTQMQRLQPGTGLLEIDRVSKLLSGLIFKTPALLKEQAVLVCPQPENMDLVIGQDLAAAYLEQKGLNHSIRVLESVLLRIKRKAAIVVFE
jgi:uncharacterized linocin/CFP29 family protein